MKVQSLHQDGSARADPKPAEKEKLSRGPISKRKTDRCVICVTELERSLGRQGNWRCSGLENNASFFVQSPWRT